MTEGAATEGASVFEGKDGWCQSGRIREQGGDRCKRFFYRVEENQAEEAWS